MVLSPFHDLVYHVSSLGKHLRDVTGFSLSLKHCKNVLCGKSELEEEEEDQVAVTPTPEDNLEEPLIDENTSLVVTTVEQPQHELPSNKSLIIDALKIMTIDLITQLCISIGVYIALRTNTSVGYQITALQAALPSVGVAYSFSIGFLFKLKAPRYIVKRDYKMFIKYTWLTLLGAFCMIPVIIGSIEPDKFKTWWAFNYGENACEYASTEQCVDFFTQGKIIESIHVLINEAVYDFTNSLLCRSCLC